MKYGDARDGSDRGTAGTQKQSTAAPFGKTCGPPIQIRIEKLKPADSPRSDGEDLQHIDLLAASEVTLPPIMVHQATMRVIDGMHRVRAAQLRGNQAISAYLIDGTPEEIFELGVRMNTVHGLPLSLKDRKRAAERIVRESPAKSDRSIAEIVGLSPKTVSSLRKKRSGGNAEPATRTGRDGRARPANPAHVRQHVAELIEAHPDRSLRQLAQMTGVAPSTVGSIKKKLASTKADKKGAGDVGLDSGSAGLAKTDPPLAKRRRALLSEKELRAIDTDEDILNRARRDPCLRFTEFGRTILRLSEIHRVSESDFRKLVDPLPPHLNNLIIQLARACSAKWLRIAVLLEEGQVNDYSI